MKKSTFIAMALGLAFLPLADGAYAQACTAGANFCPQSSSGPEVPVPKVCFYTAPDFKGLFFCEAGLRTVSTVPPQWRNKIKSITVGDNTAVQICPADVLQGNCNLIDRNTAKLERGLFNHVHSYDIRQTY